MFCGKDAINNMKNIKQQFQDFRSDTPKHIQWLLLGIAFIVVIILLTLLLYHKKPVSENLIPKTPEVKIEPKEISFGNVKVGDKVEKKVVITTDMPIAFGDVGLQEKNSDIQVISSCWDYVASTCDIRLYYKPTSAQVVSNTDLIIPWHQGDDDFEQNEIVKITYGAYEEKKEEPISIPEPIEEPEPEPEQEPEPLPLPEPPIDIPNPFVPETEPEPEPLPLPEAPKKCSEFAFPGYDVSGRQIGWVKPERGAYYFYPLSDKECATPTGRYDFNTGIITSLKDGSKIGTDSDHIGYRNVRQRDLVLPSLSHKNSSDNVARLENGKFVGAEWGKTDSFTKGSERKNSYRKHERKGTSESNPDKYKGSAGEGEYIASSMPYDRTFILRQFKPIPATIVSEVRADPSVYGCTKKGPGQECDPNENYSVPVRATVDRNVYSDNGRTVILPAGTLMMGYLDGKLPGPYQTFGRMNIKWYQFIRPDGVEFNFGETQDPYSADAQGRMGVPGHGSTDYVEQMVMPILTALVPAAVNMIAPITDTVINQIDLDNNTIVQSGTIRSSEMAKQDIINTWNKITQKLIVDAIDNTVPPFSIAAGTRINVFSPVDLIVTCGVPEEFKNKKCAIMAYGEGANEGGRRNWSDLQKKVKGTADDGSWKGQIRSFDLNKYCEYDSTTQRVSIKEDSTWVESGYDYRTVLAYCESQNYQAINNAKNTAYYTNVQQQAQKKQNEYGITGYSWDDAKGLTPNVSTQTEEQLQKYNEEILGLKYDDEGNIINPFSGQQNFEEELTCEGGARFDEYGCCPGETYTNMGDSYVDENGSHFACCPETGGDCFPPANLN